MTLYNLIKALYYSVTYTKPIRIKKVQRVCPICNIAHDPTNNIACMCSVGYIIYKRPGEEYAV